MDAPVEIENIIFSRFVNQIIPFEFISIKHIIVKRRIGLNEQKSELTGILDFI